MAVPPHTSFATAIDLGLIAGATATYDVHDSGTTYDVFYAFSINPASHAVWAFAFGGTVGSGYQPHLELYDADQNLLFTGGDNLPLSVPVSSGGPFYLKIVKNANVSPSVFTLQIVVHVVRPQSNDTIFVPNDTTAYPATVLSTQADHVVIDVVNPFPAGEQGDILHGATRVILVEDVDDGDLKLFDLEYTQLAAIAFTGTPIIRTNRNRQTFFVASDSSPDITVQEINAGGSVVATHTLVGIGDGVSALATSADGTILYHADDKTNAPIRRTDLTTDTALSDLVAGEVLYFISDLLVMDDGSIVGMYSNNITNGRVFTRRFGVSGTLLTTVDFGKASEHDFPSGTRPRLAYDPEPGFYWVMLHPAQESEVGVSVFHRIFAETGEIVLTRTFVNYETAQLVTPDAEETPQARFGPSFSCPFFVVPATVFIDESVPCCPEDPAPCECPPAGGGPSDGSPSSQPIPTATGPVLPPAIPIGPADILSDPYWTAQCDGGGLVPTAADPVDAESWVA